MQRADGDRTDRRLKAPKAGPEETRRDILRYGEYPNGTGEDAAVQHTVDEELRTKIAEQKAIRDKTARRTPLKGKAAELELDELVAAAKDRMRRSKWSVLDDPDHRVDEFLGAISDTLDEYDKKRHSEESGIEYRPLAQSG